MKINLMTERLVLRPFDENDAEEAFNNWTSDEEVSKYLTWNPHKTIEDTKRIISLWICQYEKPERINFAIVLKETNELIGGIDVVGYIDGIPVIGYVLARKYWNNGYISEACNEVVKFLFSLGYEQIRIDAVKENIGSNKVIQKCGGTFIKEYIEYFPQKNIEFVINEYIIKK